MSDRIPGTTWDNPIWHRDYRIYRDDCAGTRRDGFAFTHDDYDPTPVYSDDGPSDHRHGWAQTLDEAKAEIDIQIEDAETDAQAYRIDAARDRITEDQINQFHKGTAGTANQAPAGYSEGESS